SPTNPDQVFTGGVNIWQTSNGGDDFSLVTHWRYDNTNDPYVHADIHYMEYYGNYLYVGCDGGIFRTNNGGISWQDLSDGLEITQIYGMGLSPNFNNIMQFGSQDNGTYRWENGIWKHIFGADGMHTIIHPTNPNIVYISTQFGNLRRSTNGGSTFTRIMNNINETGLWVTPYIMHPTDPNTLYVGKDNLWRTTNGGFSFTQIAIGGKIRHIAQSESDPDVIYYTTGSRPFKTANGGTTWSMTTGGLPMGAGITDMKVGHKDPNVVYLTFGGYLELAKVFKSTDGGQNWVSIGDGLPNLPVNCLVEQKGEKERLYVGMDVGVYYWEEGMAEWEPFFDGMPNVIVNDLKIQYNIGTIRAGTYGRGVWESQLYHVNVSNETQTLKDNSKVYPNPASGQVFIESPEDAQVQMMGVDGSVIRNFSVINGQRFALDIGQIPGGVYVLKFETVKGSFTKKCVVQ
ncbi:MAG: T9SS type A sorting domain-containing protein, partial [Cryomorphaceae bacterium]|nr:T9SS type A sorting domain-containing protein [Cryomorphaceae bacterium]